MVKVARRERMAARPESVGDRIAQAREAKGLTLRECQVEGASSTHVFRIERGDRHPSMKVLRRLAERLDVSVRYLETGRDEVELALRRETALALLVRLKRELDEDYADDPVYAELTAALQDALPHERAVEVLWR